jgi:YD repeat-containing protein
MWASEVFPACPTAPFIGIGSVHICAGTCPKPCVESFFSSDRQSALIVGPRRPEQSSLVTYDARGRFARMDTSYDETANTVGSYVACQYEAGLLATCNLDGGERARRDSQGRVVEIRSVRQAISIEYDAAGRVSEIGGGAVHYDTAGRVERIERAEPLSPDNWGHVVLERDDNGRVRVERGRRTLRRFSYDDRGRVTRILEERIDDTAPLGMGTTLEETTDYTYAGDKLVSVVSEGMRRYEHEYGYDCPAR